MKREEEGEIADMKEEEEEKFIYTIQSALEFQLLLTHSSSSSTII